MMDGTITIIYNKELTIELGVDHPDYLCHNLDGPSPALTDVYF